MTLLPFFIVTILLLLCETISPLIKVSIKKRLIHYFFNVTYFVISRFFFLAVTSFLIFEFFDFRSKFFSVSNLFLSILVLDFFLWLQHLISHKLDFIWKLHQVHHCDEYLDLTSAFRFHPAELILSYFYKMLVVFIFGISLEHFLIFEAIIPLFAMFNHSNLRLPISLERILSQIIITPKLHQVHHSDLNSEMNSNFGTIFVFWDKSSRKFIKYENRNTQFRIGLKNIDLKSSRSILKLFTLPFKN